MKIRIENGFVVTADSNDTCIDGCVLVENDIIVYVGTEAEAPLFAADRIIDAQGGIVAPGFINTHTHVPMTMMRGYADDTALMDWLQNHIWPAEARLTEDAVYWGTMLSMSEFAAAGVTCFSDMYNFNEQIARAAHDSGIRALIATAVLDIDGGGDTRLKRAEAFFDFVKDYDRIQAAIGPHAEYTVSPAMFKRIRDLAEKLNSRIHVHISETKGEHEESIARHGKTPIGLLESLGVLELPVMAAHCVWVSDEDMDIMACHGVSVMSCPGSNLKLGSGIPRVAKMLEKGVNVSCATDGAASNNNLSMMEEMTLTALLQKGVNLDPSLIPAKEALRIATINGAKALGLSEITGSLEAGKQADLIIIDTKGVRWCPRANLVNHLVYSGSDADVKLTMVGGDIIYENGQITFGDIEEIKAKASHYAAELFA
jgi:5-methylthioadenosine/S-adenosylhomocysteine deaminase